MYYQQLERYIDRNRHKDVVITVITGDRQLTRVHVECRHSSHLYFHYFKTHCCSAPCRDTTEE